jgi:hypothetical protein
MYFLNTKYGFVAKIGKRSTATSKGYVSIPESFTPDLRRAIPFVSFLMAQQFAKDNSFQYWAILNPHVKVISNVLDTEA